jgi:uncharacterized repeat protein (TIGR03943 family)
MKLSARVAAVCLLVALAAVLAWEAISGRVYLYIHDRSLWLIVLAVPVLLVLAGMSIWVRATAPSARSWAVLLVPLLLAVVVPARPLGSDALAAQQVASSTSAPRLADVTTTVTLQTSNRVWDIKQLGLADLDASNSIKVDGQRADLVGFVYRPDGESADEFQVGRFLVRCCTADAVAVSFPVQYADAANLTRDTWVDVQGTLRAGASGASKPVLVADSVRVVDAPERPYLQLP